MIVIVDSMGFVHRVDETSLSPQKFEERMEDLREEINSITGDMMRPENC